MNRLQKAVIDFTEGLENYNSKPDLSVEFKRVLNAIIESERYQDMKRLSQLSVIEQDLKVQENLS